MLSQTLGEGNAGFSPRHFYGMGGEKEGRYVGSLRMFCDVEDPKVSLWVTRSQASRRGQG